jgi:hypothetical protein
LTEGRAELESLLGHRLTMIAYPHGKADTRVADAARAAAFDYGFTGRTRRGSTGLRSNRRGNIGSLGPLARTCGSPISSPRTSCPNSWSAWSLG